MANDYVLVIVRVPWSSLFLFFLFFPFSFLRICPIFTAVPFRVVVIFQCRLTKWWLVDGLVRALLLNYWVSNLLISQPDLFGLFCDFLCYITVYNELVHLP